MMCIAYIIAGNEEEAEKISDHLLEKRLVACVNSFPVKSKYWWQGKLESDTEVAMIAKTRDELVDELIREVRAVHSYDVPAIDIIPLKPGYRELEDWLVSETSVEKQGRTTSK